MPTATVRAHPQALHAPLDGFAHFVTSVSSSQAVNKLPSLDPAQPLDCLDDLIQLSLAHRKPRLGQSGTSRCKQFAGRLAHGVSRSLLNANRAQESGG